MKEYFIFNVKKEFISLYKERPSELYFILNRIYNMKSIDKYYGYSLFEQICNFFDKDEINNFICYNYKDKIMYSMSQNEHIINNLYSNDISILKVKSSNLRLETNNSNSSYFSTLKDYNSNLFVCNFKEQDYFFIKNIKVKN